MYIEPREFVVIPTGDYPATIKDVTAEEGQFGPQLKFIFDLGQVEDVEGNTEDRTLSAWCSKTLSSTSKLWGWAEAAGLDPGEGVHTEELIGRSVVLTTVIKEKDGKTFNRIESVRKAAKRGKAPGATQRAAAPTPEPAAADAIPEYATESVPF